MRKTEPVSLLIADDQEIFREGLLRIFQKINTLHLLPAATNSTELVAHAKKYSPGILLVRAGLIEKDWLPATALKEKFIPAAIIVFTGNDDLALAEELRSSGIKTLTGSAGSQEFITTITKEIEALPVRADGNIKERTSVKNPRNMSLSAKEIEVLELICNEHSSREISARLHLSIRTIEGYRENIAKKTGARNIAGIVVYAIKNGLFKP